MAIRKRTYVDFRSSPPLVSIGQKGGTAGADASVTMLQVGGEAFEMRMEQANADVTGARLVDANCCNGLEIPLDNTDGDGIEITQGILADAAAKNAFTIGTDGPFELRVKFGVPDVSDHVIYLGFRVAAAYVDAISEATIANIQTNGRTAYTDKAAFEIYAGDMSIITSNDNTDVATNIAAAWAADAVKTLTVKVSAAGAVTYQIDGSAVGDAVAFSFDSTDIVVPYMFVGKGEADVDTPPILQTWFCGLSES